MKEASKKIAIDKLRKIITLEKKDPEEIRVCVKKIC